MSELISPAFSSDKTIGRVLYTFTAPADTSSYYDFYTFTGYEFPYNKRYTVTLSALDEDKLEHRVLLTYYTYFIRISYTYQTAYLYDNETSSNLGIGSSNTLIHLIGY